MHPESIILATTYRFLFDTHNTRYLPWLIFLGGAGCTNTLARHGKRYAAHAGREASNGGRCLKCLKIA